MHPLLAREIMNSAPTANTAPAAEMEEYSQMKRTELRMSVSSENSRTPGANIVAEEPAVIPGIHPTSVPPRRERRRSLTPGECAADLSTQMSASRPGLDLSPSTSPGTPYSPANKGSRSDD